MPIHLKRLAAVFLALGLASITGSASNAFAQSGAGHARPNIVFILADDQGWNHLSVPMHDGIPGSGSDYFRTPNIERIAAAGMRFSSAYAAAPMCGPSRAALHFGKSAAQVMYSESADEVQAASTTIGELMQSAGYATAHFGKWWPGPPPTGLQFYDESDGEAGNDEGNVNDPANPKDIFGITERAIAFMEASVGAGRPFYMQLSHYAPHVGFHALAETIEQWQDVEPGELHSDPVYAAMTEDLDTGIGRVLDKLQDLGIEDNTYVIYTSDHGQTANLSTNAPLSHGKGTLWEGGMRVPFIVSGPGITPGTISDSRIVLVDLFPTFAELAGATESAPDDLEGGSLVPLLHGSGEGDVRRSREELVFHYARPSGNPDFRGSSSIYLENFKLLKFYDTGELLLFDIAEDPREQIELADRMPAIVEELHRRLTGYLDEVNATIPESSTSAPGAGPGGAFSIAAAQDDACADLYLVNGRFFSMVELPQTAGGVVESDFNSLRIEGNAIAEVGDDLVPPDCATTIDLDGRTVIPGLNDTHMHFIRATLRPGYDTRELELSRSIPEALDMIAAKSAAMAEAGVPTDQWITFIGGWDPIQWDENPVGSGPGGGPAYVFPTLEQLDAAAGDYPFYIHLRSTEDAYTNSLGVARLNELAAMTEGEGDPQIDPATGFVADSTAAFRLIKQDSDPREQAIRVMRGFNGVGLTSVVDVGGSIRGMGAQYFDVFSDYETMKGLYDAGELTIRVRARVQGDLITPVEDYEALVHSIAAEFGSEDDSMFKVIGLGEDLGDIATNGYQNVVEMAILNGWQVGKHAGALADIDTYHDAAVATGKVTRLILEHSSPGAAEFDRIRELGYEDIVGANLSSHAFYGRGAAGRACGSVPFRTIVEEGFHAGIGTDSTNAQPSNPWINIYAMVTGKDVKGFGLRSGGMTTLRAATAGGMGGMAAMGAGAAAAIDPDAPITCPDERISRAQAVQLYTKGSAWLAGSEDVYGTLEQGKLADLVVLSDDLFSPSVSDDEIQGIRSLMTIVDGKIVYVDEDAGFSPGADD